MLLIATVSGRMLRSKETVIQFNHARNSGWELLLVAEDHNDTEMNFLPRALWGPVTSCEKQDD